jgi:hypothetical protein
VRWGLPAAPDRYLGRPTGETVLLLGFPGIGKSALATATLHSLPKLHVAWHTVRPWDGALGLLGVAAEMLASLGKRRLRNLLRGLAVVPPEGWFVLEDEWPEEPVVLVCDHIHATGPEGGKALLQGDWDGARREFLLALPRFVSTSDGKREDEVHHHLGLAALAESRLEEAEAEFARALAAAAAVATGAEPVRLRSEAERLSDGLGTPAAARSGDL